jgi:hypothetical protein
MRILTDFIFLVFFLFLVGIWAVAWLVYHVASGGIHVLLGFAVVCLIIHLARGGARA